MEKRFLVLVLGCMCSCLVWSQALVGTTGLLHMPTADMQKDKTFMLGGGWLDEHTLPDYWNNKNYDHTFNYYINITFFPWLEVSYTCTLVKGGKGNYWPSQTWGKFVNQDRSFNFRLRLWKEGWWKEWTPQIVLGSDDVGTHASNGGGEITSGGSDGNHNYLTRYYLAATKHWKFSNVGDWGLHAAFVIGNGMTTEHYKRLALGTNFRFGLPGTSFINKAVNGLNLMAEYDARTINVGATYSLWKDRINFVAELNDGKYFSGGLYFKVCLK